MAMHLLALVALFPITVQPVPTLAEGVAALNAGRAEEAVTLLEPVALAQPRSRLVLLHLANAQRAAHRYPAAATTLRELLRLDPGDKLALWNLAVVEADPGLTTLRKLIALDPSYPNVFTALAAMQTMQARDAYRTGKRAADVRVEDGEWIAALRRERRSVVPRGLRSTKPRLRASRRARAMPRRRNRSSC